MTDVWRFRDFWRVRGPNSWEEGFSALDFDERRESDFIILGGTRGVELLSISVFSSLARTDFSLLWTEDCFLRDNSCPR